jgi:2-oxoisovalerate dehydrogenase E1 component
MAATYDDNRSICKYVHSTSRGHEAIQIAAGLQLASHDCAAPYYRDEAMLLAMGWSPYELMLQLLAKADDPFSGGRTYYSHPANRGNNRPLIPHQSSATGMQVIPATGLAQGIKYIETQKLKEYPTPPVTLCSVGDGAMTEGEVSEALQFAVLKQLPIIYLVQDNDWGISVSSDEARAMDAYEYAAGFKGLNRMRVDGSDFILSWNAINSCIQFVRNQRKPILLHAKVPLLGHHTSGVRKEWYRSEEDLRKHAADDPFNKLEQYLIRSGLSKELITKINTEAKDYIDSSFEKAKRAPEPESGSVMNHIFAESPVTDEQGSRTPYHVSEKTVMVDAALHAVDEILRQHPEALFYGQDVGRRLGGVFREAATLAEKHGDERVFNTAIQEAYIIGSTAGLSALGLKPIVEIQFADYIWPGINQLVTELSKSCYLSRGQFPVQSLIRIPIGA